MIKNLEKLKEFVKQKGFHLEKEPSAIDVVCGMQLNKKQMKFRLLHKSQIYHFCTANCRDHFKHNPEMYIGG